MISDLNRVVLMGYLGADAAKDKNPDAPITFSIATTARWIDKAGQRQSRTEWHNIVVFNKLSRFAAKLKKGDRVYLEGELRTSKWEKTIGGETLRLIRYEVYASQIDRVAKAEDPEDDATSQEVTPTYA
ncbi:Single-stranded DNA-binding protein [Acidisarcina polymorpha]|uniref:Single-stranded DNA-binding protein n=1 Tax=Acidisarcina polymorpha TaxID=2211140 RepID=A0A2Z5FZL5_9BACT|nr:single-stranded DNA-binding protein [Acidisarcina polymorpha]AXC11974.1 Single-stranded DNA-binding protein [Acidisarcina polymorpha]